MRGESMAMILHSDTIEGLHVTVNHARVSLSFCREALCHV